MTSSIIKAWCGPWGCREKAQSWGRGGWGQHVWRSWLLHSGQVLSREWAERHPGRGTRRYRPTVRVCEDRPWCGWDGDKGENKELKKGVQTAKSPEINIFIWHILFIWYIHPSMNTWVAPTCWLLCNAARNLTLQLQVNFSLPKHLVSSVTISSSSRLRGTGITPIEWDSLADLQSKGWRSGKVNQWKFTTQWKITFQAQ